MGATTALDVRLPIGGLLPVLGVILAACGLLTAADTAHYSRSLNFNINLWWGLVLLAFGLGFLLSATFYRGGWSGRPATQTPEGRATEERERRLGLER